MSAVLIADALLVSCAVAMLTLAICGTAAVLAWLIATTTD